jgi:hypothetical protein
MITGLDCVSLAEQFESMLLLEFDGVILERGNLGLG